MALLEFNKVVKYYRGLPALDGIDLEIAPDTLTVICGPPQSGKSVLLRLLVGLETPDAGEIVLDGQPLTRVPAGGRPVGYVPQSFALFPHLTVRTNIAYPLRIARVGHDVVERRLQRVSELLNIGHLLDHTPDQLSGGEKQRTAVARGLMKDATLFVLDDPLVGLDFKLRERLMDDLRDMRRDLGIAFVYVTGDPVEALTMADDLVVLDAGRVIEHNDVLSIYHEPHRLRSAELIGFPACNLLAGREDRGRCRTPLFAFEVESDTPRLPSAMSVALRPEDVDLGARSGPLCARGTVRLVENLGAECVVYLSVDGQPITTTVRVDEGHVPVEGEQVDFTVAPESLIAFDTGSGRRIGRGRSAAHA